MIDIYFTIKNDQVEALSQEVENYTTPDIIFDADQNPKIPKILQNFPPIVSVAAFLGSPKCFAFLINHGADISITDKSKESLLPIDFAVAGKNISYFRVLCSKGSPTTALLHNTIRFDVVPILNEILEKKIVDINEEVNGKTPVEYAMSINKICAAKILLEAGAVFSSKLINEMKMMKNQEAVNLLLSFKAQLTDPVVRHEHILNNAVMSGDIELVKSIIYGEKMKINDEDEKGNTAFIVAAIKGDVNMLKFISSIDGADYNHRNRGGRAAIHEAAYKGKSDVIKFLLTLPGLNPFAVTSNGRTALHCAAKNGNIETVEALLTIKGINVNKQDNDGDTPLHIAANNKNVDVIHRLLDVPGIKFNIHNKGGRAAFDLCSHPFLVQFRPKMDEIIANARARIHEIKAAKKKARNKAKEERSKEEEFIQDGSI